MNDNQGIVAGSRGSSEGQRAGPAGSGPRLCFTSLALRGAVKEGEAGLAEECPMKTRLGRFSVSSCASSAESQLHKWPWPATQQPRRARLFGEQRPVWGGPRAAVERQLGAKEERRVESPEIPAHNGASSLAGSFREVIPPLCARFLYFIKSSQDSWKT